MSQAITSDVHPFEASGLGKAPFRYVGMVAQDIEFGRRRLNSRDEAVSVTTAPGGSCDHCGAYIIDMYRIRSADGIESVVGSTCINKVHKVTPLGDKAKLKADLKSVTKAKAAIKKGKEAERIKAACLALEAGIEALRSEPHPAKCFSEQGKSMHDYCEWMMANAGHSGRFETCKIIERALKG